MKLRFLLLISGLYFLVPALLPSASLAAVDCTIPNDWTGLCDGNYKQCSSGYCCRNLNDCNSVNPQDLPAFSHDTTGTGAVNSDLNRGSATTTVTNKALCDPVGGKAGTGINTALGCLAAGDPTKLVSQLWGWGISVGGLIAFVLIVFSGFQIVTSAGDPKRYKAAQELMTSAIGGLILIVLSVVLLNFIGVTVLKLPGF
ncbi:MAG: pilin [Patescibacteria group bacterium]